MRMTPQFQPRPTTAAMILEQAATLFRQKGYSKTTTSDLGTAVGIRGPSVYHHFRTKEDILFGICSESLRRLTGAVTEASAGVEGALDRLRVMIETHVANLLGDSDMHTTAFMEMRWLSDERRAEVHTQRDAYEELFTQAVRDAQADGSLRKDKQAHELTLVLLGAMNWSVFWYRPAGSLSIPDVAALMVTTFLEGAMAR
jgi:TetR/AcrR family transcriptional regulator, cholesterol catabolism regulator